MLLDLIRTIRPADNTSAAIAAAMQRARAAQTEADEAVAAAEQAWRDGLLDADLRGLDKLEARLNEAKTVAQATAARVAAVLQQLEVRHAAAKRAEVLGMEETAREAAEETGRALAQWWARNKAKLAALLREGEQLDTAYGTAQGAWISADNASRAAYPDLAQQMPAPTGSTAADWQGNVGVMMERPYVLRPVVEPTPEELEARAELERQRAASAAEYRQRNDPRFNRYPVGGVTMIGR